MYQELIIEGDFGKERLAHEGRPTAHTFPAIRLIFTMHKERPILGAIDACTLTRCQ